MERGRLCRPPLVLHTHSSAPLTLLSPKEKSFRWLLSWLCWSSSIFVTHGGKGAHQLSSPTTWVHTGTEYDGHSSWHIFFSSHCTQAAFQSHSRLQNGCTACDGSSPSPFLIIFLRPFSLKPLETSGACRQLIRILQQFRSSFRTSSYVLENMVGEVWENDGASLLSH